MPAVTTTSKVVVDTINSPDFRTRCAIALMKVAHARYQTGQGLASEVLRNPTRYVENVAIACGAFPNIQTAIREANDGERAFWPTDKMLEDVVTTLWPGLEGK